MVPWGVGGCLKCLAGHMELVYGNLFVMVGISFLGFLKFEVGDGSQIRFWDDVWCLDESLKAAFMELYRITCVRDAAVANIIRIRSESVHWEVNFTRLFQDWELESISSFLELLYSTSIQKPEEDKMCWKVSKNKGFQVRSYYKALSSNGVGSFLWKSIWKSKVPSPAPGVAFFS